MSQRKIVGGVKDSNGVYLPTTKVTSNTPPKEVSLDSILERQLQALDETTTQLLGAARKGFLSKDEIQSLATCIKITLELKARENELLDQLDSEELKKLAEK